MDKALAWGRPPTWRRTLLLTLAIATLGPARLAAQGTNRVPPSPWPTELGEAFELYYANEFLETQRVCRQLGARTRDARLRREAHVLAALATMRLPGRADRLDGRAQLSQLAQENPSLLTRPECQLAYGIAQTADSATATALHHLNEAADTFAQRGQTNRLAETLVALAHAWARHGEWELPVPRMAIPRPQKPGDANRIRAERIRALRQRLAALPVNEPYSARIDFILARQLLDSEGSAAEGMTLLETLARRGRITATTAQAGLTLAEHREAARRWTDAVELYARVQAADLGELSRRAEQRRNAIEQPRLVLNVPGQVAVGQRVDVDLGVRNLPAVEFEVRRVDLADWLVQRQGRFAESALPTSGALVALRDFNTTVKTQHDWWRSTSLDDPLAFEAPAGAVVVLARAATSSGRTVISKRLVLVGDLRAAVFLGTQRAAIWATRGPRAAAITGQPEPQARFWMHGSFVPTRPQFTDSVAVFALPPEARLLRDKRWVCLVQAGEQVALCQGALPAGNDRPRRPAVALIGGPPELRVGEQLHVFGLLIGAPSLRVTGQPPQTVETRLLDAHDRVLSTTTAAVCDAGTFSAHLLISPAMAGKTLRVAVRRDDQVLESVFSPLSARVAPLDVTPLSVRCVLPRWLPATPKSLVGQITAAYPWGTGACGVYASTKCRGVRLPIAEAQGEPVYSHALSHRLWLDAEGRIDFVQPLTDLHLPEGPWAIGLWADVVGWDDRHSQGSVQTLIGPTPVHLWLRCEPDTPRVAEPLYVGVGWFDPTGRAAATRPTVAVWRDGTLLANLQMLPAVTGLRSAAWRPTMPGRYEIVATLPLSGGDAATARETIRVEGHATMDQQDLTPIRCQASVQQHNGRPHVRVQLDAQRRHPLLVLLEAGDPLVGRQLPSLDGPSELLLPLAGPHYAELKLVLAAPGRESVQVLGVTDVRLADSQTLTLSLTGVPDEVTPGATVEVSAVCLRENRPVPDATLMARLVDASHGGDVQWVPGEARADRSRLPGGLQVVSSAGPSATTSASGGDVIPETRELPAPLARALFEGPTLWLNAQPAGNGSASFTVPLPPRPGRYRLVVTAHTRDAAFACETLDLDARSGVRLTADVPQQLTLGDRCVASLIITNDQPTTVPARVTCETGPGLHLDELRPLDRQIRLEPTRNGESFELTLAPFSTLTLRARVEAAQPGTGTLAFIVETKQRQRRAAAPCVVHPVSAATETAEETPPLNIALRRTLFLLEEEEPVADAARPEEGVRHWDQREWLRFELEPGERISPGQLVLVQEEFTLQRLLEQVVWQQRLPGSCYTHAGDWSEFRRIGTPGELRLDSLTHRTARLAADRRHIHEYVIVPVRPGACQFPPPVVHAAGQPVHVELTPPTRRLLVAESN